MCAAGATPLVFCLGSGGDKGGRADPDDAKERAKWDRPRDRADIDSATGTIRVTHVTTLRDLERLIAAPHADNSRLRRFTVTVKNAGAPGLVRAAARRSASQPASQTDRQTDRQPDRQADSPNAIVLWEGLSVGLSRSASDQAHPHAEGQPCRSREA
jgi:hypothetical protein